MYAGIQQQDRTAIGQMRDQTRAFENRETRPPVGSAAAGKKKSGKDTTRWAAQSATIHWW